MSNESNKAFDKAIAQKRLSTNPDDRNYAGNYMYMGSSLGGDAFKNINSRQYDV